MSAPKRAESLPRKPTKAARTRTKAMKIDALDGKLIDRLQVAAFVHDTSVVKELEIAIRVYCHALANNEGFVAQMLVMVDDSESDLAKWMNE